MPLRPGSSGKGLRLVCGRFRVQVLMRTKREKIKNKNEVAEISTAAGLRFWGCLGAKLKIKTG